MDNYDHRLENMFRRVRMTTGERQRMRDSIMSTLGTESTGDLTMLPVPSPYAPFFVRTRVVSACIAIVFLLVMVPVTYAADKSLPGDALYSVKTDIIEPFIEAFIFDNQKRAGRIIDNAERRLDELMLVFSRDTEEVDAESIADASEELIEKLAKARDAITALDISEAGKIELYKKLLTVLEAYIAVLERDGDGHYASVIERVSAGADSLQQDLIGSIDVFFTTADEQTVSDTINSIVTTFSDEIETASATEEVRLDVFTDAIEDALEEMREDDANEALKTLILSGQDADVIERLEKHVPLPPLPVPSTDI